MKIVYNYAWSTHKPLLASLVSVANPGFILELGMGVHSTPIFLNSKCKDIIFIENDAEWLSYIKENNSFDSRCEAIFHDLGPNISMAKILFQRDLSLQQRAEIIEYYKNLSGRVASKTGIPKMMFVDNFTCCRTLAINTLYKNFDIVVYHDCEPLGIPWYEYYFEDDLKQNFCHYILKTPKSWTGCFISNELDIGLRLENNIKQYILEYSKEIGVDTGQIYLHKGY